MIKRSLISGLPDFRLTRKHTALVLFILLSGSELAAGQPNHPDQRDDPYRYKGSLSPALAVVVIVLIAILFFMGIFVVYIRHFTHATDAGVNHAGVAARAATNAAAARGLEASTIDTFPTFAYSVVKTQKIGKGALECAICLNEFQDDETLRLLPKCDHVFHPHCIGAWLTGHVTCPVCRTNLAEQQQPTVEPEVITETDLEAQQSAVPEPAVESVSRVKFSRSHTTGHSVVLPAESTDRFTLRLPEELRKKIMANWKLNRSNSLLVIPKGGSLRISKPVDRSRARSDRWLFSKTPSFLWRSQDDGSIKLSGTSSTIKTNAITSPTGDSVRADRWAFLRNPSFLWRNTPVQSPRVGDNKDGEGISSVQQTGTAELTSGSVRLPV